jgi:ISXO2-like transposase domain/Transposase zinc-ribbon domain
MARNKVQFQKGLSEVEFERLYGTEDLCRAALEKWRWPNGFICPACDGREHHFIKTRGLYQCSECHHQASLTAGTIFASTKLALKTWFRAMYHMTQTKQAIELGHRLGVTQTTAWKLKHKLAQVMMERDATKRLVGLIEMDDAYLGDERAGGKRGRGSPGKTPIIVAVEATPQGQPVRLKMRRIKRLKRKRVKTLASRMLDRQIIVLTDGLKCFRGVADAGSMHLPIRTGSGRQAARHPAFKWANTVLGNIKNSLTATYRGIS